MQVLLGESYYAECSAKQTVEILDRRGKLLNSRIDDVKSQLADLDMESRFFSETLAEASVSMLATLLVFVIVCWSFGLKLTSFAPNSSDAIRGVKLSDL